MTAHSLTTQQIKALESHGPLVGSQRYVLDQFVYEGESPYFIELILGGSPGLTKAELRRQLRVRDRLDDTAVEQVINTTGCRLSRRRQLFKCVLLTQAELGLQTSCTLQDLALAGRSRGLNLFPTDAALFAALQFQDGWTTDKLVVVMSEAVVYEQRRYVFALRGRTVQAINAETTLPRVTTKVATKATRSYMFWRE